MKKSRYREGCANSIEMANDLSASTRGATSGAHDTEADEELILQIEFSLMRSAMFSECHYTLDSIHPINPVDYATKRLY